MTDTIAPISTNSESAQRINEYERKIESLLKEIEQLRVKNEESRARLLEAIVANQQYIREIKRLQEENNQLKRTPLFIGTVIDIDDDLVMVRQHGNNQEFITQVNKKMLKKLQLGVRVAMNNALSIVKILKKQLDERALVMELIEAPDVDYNSIGGLEPQIQEVIETIELPLTDPELFKKVGVEPPRGVLLYGAPGTGKTLLAKAVANRTKATFIKMSGSELVQKFIGEGARLVRDMFQMAREKAPSIVFIDEIDAVGGMRTYDGTTGSAEVNRTMMQILAELDGFNDRGNVRVMAATNRIDILDPALLRPGRFDRVIEIPLPDKQGRLEILKIHTKNMSLADDVNLEEISAITDGASGAVLKAIVTEAGMFAIRKRNQYITREDFISAYNKVFYIDKEESSDMFV